MVLKSITLEGYRSVPQNKPLELQKLGRFNILIGPNNSGKSTVLRFLQVVASLVDKRAELLIKIPWGQVDRSWWWQSEIGHPIRAELVFEAPAPPYDIEGDAPANLSTMGNGAYQSLSQRIRPKPAPF